MYSQTSTQASAAFDGIYRKVPTEQVDRLKKFRLTHPYKQISVGKTKWEYITCGQGEQTLLLLPGALSVGESTFPFITAFENECRIIAPSYALSLTMTGLCRGLAHISGNRGSESSSRTRRFIRRARGATFCSPVSRESP